MIDNLFKQIHSWKYNRKYKVYIFSNDNIRYRNKQRIIRNYKIKEIKTFYSYRVNEKLSKVELNYIVQINEKLAK